jgi:hypothetical protein
LIETASFTKNKEEYWVRFSMIPIYNSDTELSHWISIQRDTEEKGKKKEKSNSLEN